MEQKFLQILNARFVAYQLIHLYLFAGFFCVWDVWLYHCYYFIFLKLMKFDCCPQQKWNRKGKKNPRLAESADCFHWERLFSCLVIPNYKSEFITLHVNSKYQKWHFHDRINPVKVFWNCIGIVLLKDSKHSKKYIAKQLTISATSWTVNHTPGKQEKSAVRSITENCHRKLSHCKQQVWTFPNKKNLHIQNQTCIYKVYIYCTSTIPRRLNCIGKNQKQVQHFKPLKHNQKTKSRN